MRIHTSDKHIILIVYRFISELSALFWIKKRCSINILRRLLKTVCKKK